jgi:pilus assembly protein CpaB
MRRRWLVVSGVALCAFGLHFAYVRALAAETRGGKSVAVIVATERLSRGAALEEKSLASREVPEEYAGGRAVPASRVKEILGLRLSVEVGAQEIVQWTDVAAREGAEGRDLAELVASGERAMTIPVDGSLSMGGLLKPGHRVDILGTFAKSRDSRSEKVTATLLQNVTVLATGDRFVAGDASGGRGGGASRFSTVTLSVGLEEAELLSYASKTGTLSLVLRGYRDLRVVDGVPEKGLDDVWEADKRNRLQNAPRGAAKQIERIR